MAQTVKRLSTMWETWVWSLGWEVPWRRKWQPTPVLLPRKSHGQRSLVSWLGKLPRWLSCKECACQCKRLKRHRFNPWVRRILWKRAWHPIPVFLPGESHGQRSLVGLHSMGLQSRTQLKWLSTYKEHEGKDHFYFVHCWISLQPSRHSKNWQNKERKEKQHCWRLSSILVILKEGFAFLFF